MLQGPATAFAGFRTGFSDFLTQRFAYKGAVGCIPAGNAAQAAKFLADRSTALRKAKKTVVETGWTESAAAAAPAPVASLAQNKAMAPVAAPVAAKPSAAASAARATPAAAAAATGGGGGASSVSALTGTLGAIFGTGGAAGGAGSSATGGAAGKSGAAKSDTGSATTGAAGQSPFEQVSNTLTSVFGSKSGSGASSADAGPKGASSGNADGGLGSAQSGSTKLVVYGCGRQDTRVACVTELTNQNQKDTLVQAADVWGDAFIVDDRGDRHTRSSGFFLNVDGDQRPQLDISYGKAARFILMFNDVPTKVQKVTLRSASGGLDVEDMSLVAANASAPGGQHH